MNGQISTVRGVVRSLDGLVAIVEVEQGGCGRCHEKEGCGGQQLTQMFCGGPKTYRVANPDGICVGEKVDVVVATDTVRRSADIVYLFPLFGLLGGAMLGIQAAGDLGAMVGGMVGLCIVWFMARRYMLVRLGNPENHPYIVSRPHS